jgi:transcriptional regulator with XRE-family HTH domain
MTPKQFLECLEVLHWSQRRLAKILNLHDTTVRRWALGEAIVSPAVAMWLERLARYAARHPPPNAVDETINNVALGKTKAGKAFLAQRAASIKRGIEFKLTFQEWWDWWQFDNRWERRGTRRGCFVMARKNDEGPYSLENIYCATPLQNVQDRKPKEPAGRSGRNPAADAARQEQFPRLTAAAGFYTVDMPLDVSFR